MNDAERAQLLDKLREGTEALRQAVAGVSEPQAAFHTAAGRWSIRDCVEHLVVTEDLLFGLTTQGRSPADPAAANLAMDGLIIRGMVNRGRKFEAPEKARPGGRFRTLADALERFDRNRRRAAEYAQGCRENMRAFSVNHPVIGPIDCYQCLLMLALHPARHAQQIQEVRADPAFPAL